MEIVYIYSLVKQFFWEYNVFPKNIFICISYIKKVPALNKWFFNNYCRENNANNLMWLIHIA